MADFNEYDAFVPKADNLETQEQTSREETLPTEAVTPPETPVVENEYDAFVDESDGRTEFQQAQIVAKDSNPDRMAEADKVAKAYGVETSFAEKNLEELKKENNLEFDRIAKDNPLTTKYLSNPTNASISKDDVEHLKKVENAYKAIRPYEPDNESYFGTLGSAAQSGMEDVGSSAMYLGLAYGLTNDDAVYESLATLSKRKQEYQANRPDFLKEFQQRTSEEAQDITTEWKRFKSSFGALREGKILEGLGKFAGGGAMTVGETLDWIQVAAKRPKAVLAVGTESLAFSAPSLALGVAGAKVGGVAGAAGGSVIPGLGTAAGGIVGTVAGGASGVFAGSTAVEVGAWINQELQNRGVDTTDPQAIKGAFQNKKFIQNIIDQAERKGVTTAAVDTLFTLTGAKFIKSGAGRGFGRKIVQGAKGTAVETAGEVTSEAAGQVAAYTGDFSKIDINDVLMEGMAGLGTSTVTATGVQAIKRSKQGVEVAREKYSKDPVNAATELTEDAKVAQDSLVEAKSLEETMNAVAESKTQERSPEKIKEMIGDDNKKVYFQKEEFDKYWSERGESPVEKAKELLAMESYESADTTGQKIEVPMAEFVSQFAGVEEHKALLNLVATKPDGMNPNQAIGQILSLQENLTKISEDARIMSEQKKVIQDGEKAVRSSLNEMAREAGVDVNRIDLEPLVAFYKTLAERSETGLSPKAFMQRFGLTLRQGTDAQANTEFEQDQGLQYGAKELKITASEGKENGQEGTGQSGSGQLQEPTPGSSTSLGEQAQAAITEPLDNTPKGRSFSTRVREAARDYFARNNLEYDQQKEYVKVDKERATRIAQAFEEMKHDPSDPLVKEAYAKMIDETLAQYQVIKESGLVIEVIQPGQDDPYGGVSQNLIDDVEQNNHMWLYPTDSGFGTLGEISDNPLLEMTEEYLGDFQMTANDVFRVVHDYFGHVKEGNGFRARGEENAWQSHVRMYSPLAARAMTTETRGQNSWLNYGPFGEANRTAGIEDTVFADQKVGLLPEWVMTEGLDRGLNKREAKEFFQSNAWNEEGYMLQDAEESEEYPGTYIVEAYDKDGSKVGEARVFEEDGVLRPDDVNFDVAIEIKEEHRRKGIGSELYKIAERQLGMPIMHRSNQSRMGAALSGDRARLGEGLNFSEIESKFEKFENEIVYKDFKDEKDFLKKAKPAQIKKYYKLKAENDFAQRLKEGDSLETIAQDMVEMMESKKPDPMFFKDPVSTLEGKVRKAKENLPQWEKKASFEYVEDTERKGKFWLHDPKTGKRLSPDKYLNFAWQMGSQHPKDKAIEIVAKIKKELKENKVKLVEAKKDKSKTEFEQASDAYELLYKNYISEILKLNSDRQSFIKKKGIKKKGDSNKARLARAEQLGFDTSKVLLHGTRSKFKEFKASRDGLSGPGVYFFSNPKNANPENYSLDGGTVIKAYAKKGKYLNLTEYSEQGLKDIAESLGLNPDKVLARKKELVEGSKKRAIDFFDRAKAKRDEKGKEPFTKAEEKRMKEGAIWDPYSNNQIIQDVRSMAKEKGIEGKDEFYQFLQDKGYLGIDNILNEQEVRTVFDPKNIRSVDAKFDLDKADSANIFNQETKGRIMFNDDKKFIIELFEAADKSTFHHETGHYFLEVLTSMVKSNQAPASLVEDFNTIKEYLGVEGDAAFTTEQHELFARSYEQYLREGKAPSSALRRAFNTFKAWLVNIYKTANDLNAPINDEIRNVFDRMLATDQEIDQARSAVGDQALFTDPIAVGMTKDQAEKYRFAKADSELKAEEQLFKDHFEQIEKEETKFWKDALNEEKEIVEAQVNQSVIYRVLAHLRYGKMPDGSPLPEGNVPFKLDLEFLEKNYDKKVLEALPKSTYKKEGGIDPEIVAAMYGFEDADNMITTLVNAPKREDLIEEIATRNLREREGDPLTKEDIEAIAIEYVNNEDRFKRIRMEYEFLAENNPTLVKSLTKRVTQRPTPDSTMREQAKKHIQSLKVKQLKPNNFRLAERRYAKEAGIALAEGDFEAAFLAKQNELMSSYLYKFAREEQTRFKKDRDWSKRIFEKDEKIAKTRDIDFVMTARAILARYGLAKSALTPQEFINNLEEYHPEAFAGMASLIKHLVKDPKHHTEMTLQDYNDLMDGIRALWGMAKESREIEIDGQKITIQAAADELIGQIDEHGTGKLKEGFKETITDQEKTKWNLLSGLASVTKVEQLVRMLDLGDANGPFRKYLFTRMSEGLDLYKVKEEEYLKKFLDLSKPVKERVDLKKKIASPEIGFTFKNKGEILGALLHIGNESNRRKLLLGREWAFLDENGILQDQKWNQFIDRMIEDGTLTKEDFDYIQAVWDLIEEIKPDAQKAQKKIVGYYFNEIKPDAFTNKFGTYRGGYAPAAIDFDETIRLKSKVDYQQEMDSMVINPTPFAGGDGHSKDRTDAAYPLDLNLTNLTKHFSDVLRYTYVKPTIVDAHKILTNPEFSARLNEFDRTLIKDVFAKVLARTDKDSLYDDGKNLPKVLSDSASYMKQFASMNIFFLNIKNTLEMPFDLIPAAKKFMPEGGARKLGPKIFKAMTSGKEMTAEIHELSNAMKTRDLGQVYEMYQETQKLFNEMTTREKAQKKGKEIAFVTQMYTQSLMESSTWMASYELFIEQGLSNDEAVRQSDAIIRMAFGDRRSINTTTIEASKILNTFQMFMPWFLAKLNNLRTDGYIAAKQYDTIMGKAYAYGATYFWHVGILGLGSELLGLALSGEMDEDDDGSVVDDILYTAILSQPKMAAMMVPLVGPIGGSVINNLADDKPFNDRIGASPALEVTAQAMYGPFKELQKGDNMDPTRFTSATLLTASAVTGLPLLPLAKPIKYLKKVDEGDAEPSGPIDFMRGLITGK